MNTRGPRHLRQALDTGFDFLASDHHQVGHLVHDNDNIGQCFGGEFFGLENGFAGIVVKSSLYGSTEHFALGERFFHTPVKARNISHAHFGHLAIAVFHFANDPFEGNDGLLGIGHHR